MRLLPTTRARSLALVCYSCCCFVAAAITQASDIGPAQTQTERDTPAKPAEVETAERLTMTAPVACRSIEGFEDYEPLPEAALTADEKLLVYYHPLNYRVIANGDSHHIHLTQAGQIRRRGQKAVLLRKENLLDYEVKLDRPPNPIYLKNIVSLKGLKPGEYDYDVLLRDKHGSTEIAKQTLQFRVVEATPSRGDGTTEAGDKQSNVRTKAPSRLRRTSHARGRKPTRR